jgi:5'(3')-deoxyribonucleotidase
MTDKIRIAIDMDEVIADTIDKFIELYKREHNTVIRLDEMTGKEFNELLPEDIKQTLKHYIHQPGFFRDIKVMEGSQEVLKALCDKYDVYIVSAAMEFPNSLIDKYNWLAEHFPFIHWKNIIFCGNKIVDVQIMIDDRIRNFASFKGRKLLYSSPHNFLITEPEYERVNTWAEVADKLL